jgi:hypothetical protein
MPAAYRIELAPDLEQLKFTGREEIDVEVAQATDVLTVNAVDLAIGKSSSLAKTPRPQKSRSTRRSRGQHSDLRMRSPRLATRSPSLTGVSVRFVQKSSGFSTGPTRRGAASACTVAIYRVGRPNRWNSALRL